MFSRNTTKGVISEKLKRLRLSRGKTQTAIAKQLGITQAGWSALERGERKPSFNLLQRIVVTLDVSADWLLLDREGESDGSGEGPDVIPTPGGDAVPVDAYLVPVVQALASNVEPVPYARAHAEAMLPLHVPDAEDAPLTGLIDARKGLFGFRMNDPRMEPWFYPGDVAICAETRAMTEGDDVWVYRAAHGEVLVRRLSSFNPETRTLSLHSLHPSQPKESLQLDEADRIGRVCAVWRRLMPPWDDDGT